jgi:hypothetical protein
VIVVQSDSVTGVFQDFAALTVIAALDNLVFVAGHQRFLGHRAQRLFVCCIFSPTLSCVLSLESIHYVERYRLCAKCDRLEFHAEDLWYAILLLRLTICKAPN